MATFKARTAEEIEAMIATGRRLARDASVASDHLGPERVEELMSLAARAGQLIRRLYGRSSHYQDTLERVLKTSNFSSMHSNWWRHVSELVGILNGMQTDIRSGLLDDFRALAQAEVFADFLEMSEHLLESGYKDPAAVVLGAVLEDSLRKLADRYDIPTTSSSGKPLTLEPLNVGLAKEGVYESLVQKQITSWANLRNDAAHGHFDKYDRDQVRQMLLFVQKFCSDHMK